MELDSRIKSLSDILTCFDVEKAEQFLGKKVYFTNHIGDFHRLKNCKYGELGAEVDDPYYPYMCKPDGNNIDTYSFFVPESSLKSKKIRPFTIEEFRKVFTIGQPIRYRCKENNVFENEVIFMGFEKLHEEDYHGSITTLVLIGHSSYDLDELFKHCEYKDVQGNWLPFGVEE